MNAIEVMKKEHRVIEKISYVIRQMCQGLFNQDPLCDTDFM